MDWYNVFWVAWHGEPNASVQDVLEMDFVELRLVTHSRDTTKPLTPSGFDANTPTDSIRWSRWLKSLDLRGRVKFYREFVP